MKNITDKKLESILKNLSPEAKPEKMFMHSLEKKLQKQFEETYLQKQSFFSRFFKLKLQFASALVVIFFTSTTIYAYSSESVVNGDLLYPLKQGTEKIEGLLAVTSEKKVEYYNKMADRRMKEFTHMEQKRNRIDKPTLKEAKRLIELSEQEFVVLEQQIELENRIQFEPESEIQAEMGISSEPEFQEQSKMMDGQLQQQKDTNKKRHERIIKVKEKMENTQKHFEEKFEPRLEELEELEREMMKEITEDIPFNNFPPNIQEQPPQNFQPNNSNNKGQPEPQNSDFPTNIQDPKQQQQQQQSPQHTQPPQPDTTNFPIQPKINDPKQPQPFSDYLKISTPKEEQLKEQIFPNVIDYDKEPQPQTQPFQEQNPQQFQPKEPAFQNYKEEIQHL